MSLSVLPNQREVPARARKRTISEDFGKFFSQISQKTAPAGAGAGAGKRRAGKEKAPHEAGLDWQAIC
jgi:hypothetical protein